MSSSIICNSSVSNKRFSRRLSVAPMMEYTDRHCRYFLRKLTKNTLLYTEMVTTGALIYGHRNDLLDFSPEEQPLALQLGGCDADDLAQCATIAQKRGYAEVNLNAGCPSNRVKEGGIGASLMADPQKVAKCIKAMKKEVDIPVTLKHRTGIASRTMGDHRGYETLYRFIDTVAEAGCKTFIVHARVAILEGLSPRENREVPPLEYDLVYQIKKDFPELEIIINGGIKNLEAARKQLDYVDGVMIGREAYHNPYILVNADKMIFNREEDSTPASRMDIANRMIPYMKEQTGQGTPLHHITRHMYGLFSGMPGARLYRRLLSENGRRQDFSPNDFKKIMAEVFTSERFKTMAENSALH